ncbi:MAG TPA: hypothetical protein VHL98_16780 [Microvirga sp.]|jgi:hypothetical protein|nr:hypothetical protein [Microvirga sp.]
MRLAGRLILIAFALPVAIAAGTLALVLIGLFDPVLAGLAGAMVRAGFEALLEAVAAAGDPGFAVERAASGVGRLALAILVAPPLLVALASEVIGARSLLWHLGATGLLTGAVPWLTRTAPAPSPTETHLTLMLVLVGAVTGFVYWLIAGNGAGPSRRPEPGSRALPSPRPEP